jgi:polyisoprenoid-binding protein YceI
MSESENGAVQYRLVAEESQFIVQAFSEGLFSAFGHDPVIAIRDFAGEAKFTVGTLSDAWVRITVKTNSLAATDDVKEKDRAEIDQMMHKDVLETAKYPEIIFESTNISVNRQGEGRYRARIIGNLTVHSVTQKNLWIQAEVAVNDNNLRAKGEFSLKQTDFQIKPVKVAGGTLKVKNELKFRFDIKGIAESGMQNVD